MGSSLSCRDGPSGQWGYSYSRILTKDGTPPQRDELLDDMTMFEIVVGQAISYLLEASGRASSCLLVTKVTNVEVP
jgi:hypothetical protein